MAFILSTSRFSKTPLINSRSGNTTYGRIEGFDIFKNVSGDNFRLETVTNSMSGRPDLIAESEYGDPHLEWILVLSNAPRNPFNWPKNGEIIKIPNRDFVRSNL